jgi:hypothetical protein
MFHNFDTTLIGIDHNATVNSYYMRDIDLHINNNETIIKNLKKLGYHNLNADQLLKNNYLEMLLDKIKNELQSNWESSIKNKTINDLICYDTNPSLMTKIERSNYLSRYLANNDTYDFYNNLTLEELGHLGY